MKDYSNKNVANVLKNIEDYISKYERGDIKRLKIDDCYDKLSIFDWWVETLSLTRLKQMRAFLKEALKLGINGYCCFKVGVAGCANGMWAHSKESENGYSPDDCTTLYRSFTTNYTCWDISDEHGDFDSSKPFDLLKTVRDLENYIVGRNMIEV